MKEKVLNIKTMELFKELKDYGIKGALKGIIDDPQTDNDMKNTAKYYMYWLEKSDTIDDPETTKYNNYDEDKLKSL